MIEQTGARVEADLLADGEVACVDVGGCPVAYARIGADYFAIDDTCTHAKVSLSEGIVDEDEMRAAMADEAKKLWTALETRPARRWWCAVRPRTSSIPTPPTAWSTR